MVALDELKKLPIKERKQIVEELTRSIYEDEHDFEESPELVEELQTRYATYLADPSTAIPWEAALAQIRSGRE
ncbi:MAG: addiction module protein [Verrucomicrobiales bacterium VVV1]|nr:MAG: addiction module protein [Verrucomicrobiales bacterium VVV1]